MLNPTLEMPIEVRPKSKHPSMMKKARGGDRFDMDSESLMPPALRYVYHILSYFVLFKNEVFGGGVL